jgi:DNA-binding transcriptional MocR family regulator
MVEDPGYPGIRASLLGHGAQVRPVAVDARAWHRRRRRALAAPRGWRW